MTVASGSYAEHIALADAHRGYLMAEVISKFLNNRYGAQIEQRRMNELVAAAAVCGWSVYLNTPCVEWSAKRIARFNEAVFGRNDFNGGF